jgi:N-methylhydantoinase A
MVRAVRVISVEQGEDPRDFTLMAFGGAGPLHASAIARQMDIRRLLIPAAPGLLCAVGALLSEPRIECARTRLMTLDGHQAPVDGELADLEAQANGWMEAEGLAPERRMLSYSVDMRYLGQNHELTVALPGRLEDNAAHQAMIERFHALHRKHYGYASPGHPIQLVTCRVVGSGRIEPMLVPRKVLGGGTPVATSTRPVYFETIGTWETCPVYWRDHLGARFTLTGPAVIEQVDSTVVLYPGDRAGVDELGHMIVEVPGDGL